MPLILIGKAAGRYLRKSEDLHKSLLWDEDSRCDRIVSHGENGLPRQFFCFQGLWWTERTDVPG